MLTNKFLTYNLKSHSFKSIHNLRIKTRKQQNLQITQEHADLEMLKRKAVHPTAPVSP